ncbi:hypothetical protein Droror1_Dr00020186 [Drosera rotundifolia]
MDIRACYTAISLASILNILDDELVENVENYITFEGDIVGEPGSEAHGGYVLLNDHDVEVELTVVALIHPGNTNVVENMVKALAGVVSSVQDQETSEESLAAVVGVFSSK